MILNIITRSNIPKCKKLCFLVPNIKFILMASSFIWCLIDIIVKPE